MFGVLPTPSHIGMSLNIQVQHVASKCKMFMKISKLSSSTAEYLINNAPVIHLRMHAMMPDGADHGSTMHCIFQLQ